MKSNFEQAKRFFPGGVNSPVRAFQSVGREPIFVHHAQGKYIYSEEKVRYLDFCSSWGPMILGHSHKKVNRAVAQALRRGSSFGAPTTTETRLAETICAVMPSIEKIRFVSSGTEAVMSALRLARAFTGKDKILKFDGCYHGHSDFLLVNAGSGLGEMSSPSSKGIPHCAYENTLSIPFNDIELFKKVLEAHHREIGAVIVEPVPGNMGVVLPKEGFLQVLREYTSKYGIVLIFDEVISGFRVSLGGAQSYFHVRPDLTTLGKIIGGGLPVGAFGGKREIMDQLAPIGQVYQAGTLSGNPLAMNAGLATLKELISHPEYYTGMSEKVNTFAQEWRKNIRYTINNISSMFTLFYTSSPINNFADAGSQNKKLFQNFYQLILEKGIYMPPSMYESAFISILHSEKDLDAILRIAVDSRLFAH